MILDLRSGIEYPPTPRPGAGAEIGEFESLNDDPASGLMVQEGQLSVSEKAGLGVVIDMSKLQETTAFWQPK